MASSRSRNSHMRSPRSVTCAPMGMPSRSLNWATDFLALATAGFCPVMVDRSRTAPSMSFASRGASPPAALRSPADVLPARPRDADLPAVLVEPVADPGRVLAVRVGQLHVAHVDRRFLVRDAAFLGTALALVGDLLVLLDHVDPLDQDLAPVRVGRDHQAAAALVTAGHHDHVIVLPDLHLEHLRRQRDDPHEALLPQFTADRTEDAGPARVTAVPDQHRGVLVEPDVGAVAAAALLARAYHDRLDDIALLHAGAGKGILHRRHDDVTDARVSPAAAAEHTDAQDLLGPRVVGDLEPRLLLDHVNSCFISPGIGARRSTVTWPSRG